MLYPSMGYSIYPSERLNPMCRYNCSPCNNRLHFGELLVAGRPDGRYEDFVASFSRVGLPLAVSFGSCGHLSVGQALYIFEGAEGRHYVVVFPMAVIPTIQVLETEAEGRQALGEPIEVRAG